MTLCGVLKDILLVCASMLIWGTPVTLIQFFGYSLALGGMIYFKLGKENLQKAFSEGQRKWAEYGVNRPVQRKLVVFLLVIFTMFLLVAGLAPSFGYDTTNAVNESKSYFSGIWSDGVMGKKVN